MYRKQIYRSNGEKQDTMRSNVFGFRWIIQALGLMYSKFTSPRENVDKMSVGANNGCGNTF